MFRTQVLESFPKLMKFSKYMNVSKKCWCSTSTSSSGSKSGETSDVGSMKSETINGIALPPEPTYCCKTGCSNCVWIKYAQEVTQLFDNGDAIAKQKIQEKVKDPKLRAFLLTQLGLNEGEESS